MAANNTESFMCGDDSFGPALQACRSGVGRNDFDFTLLFEQSILSILPSAFLLLAAALRNVQLFSGPKKVKRDRYYSIKLLTIVVFGILQLALLILWAQSDVVKTRASTAAATLTFLDALSLYALSHAEHIKSIRPSSIIGVYLLLSSLFDAVQCRTLWLLPAPRAISGLFSASIGVKLAMLFLEAREKGSLIIPRWATGSPEEIGGVFNRSLFWWLNGLMASGYNSMLNMDRLYTTDSALNSAELLEATASQWGKSDQKRPRALFWAVLRTLRLPLLSAIVPRLAKTGFTFSQPFLINTVITYVGKPEGANDLNAGYGLIGATGLIYIGLAISNGLYQHKAYRFVTASRGALVSLIFSKTLSLSATATANVDTTAALSLMSTDVEGICMALTTIHDLWSCIMEAAIAIYLLQRQIGLACIVPIIVAAVCTVATSYLSKWSPPARAAWNAAIQDRVSQTSGILSYMREVKLLGLTERWLRDIQQLRERELELSKRSRKLNVWTNLVSNSTSYITPVATFGIFVIIANKSGQTFDVATALTSLSIINLLAEPMASLFFSWPRLAGAIGLFDRIQTFLNSESRPTRDIIEVASPAGVSGQSEDDIELKSIQIPRPQVKSSTAETESAVIVLENASYSLKLGDLPILRNIDLKITRGSSTMIIGKVGSGKSTLLKGILGEIPTTAGHAECIATTTAYCDQQSWLVNDTIQNNIIGESGINLRWYGEIIRACALDKDFDQLPLGDQSVVGSNGLTLSGGQKQRVALARAVYARNDLVLVDDILSGLDWATEEHVWTNIFGPRGLLKGSTVVIATHAIRHINAVDNIVVMDNGSIAQQGHFNQLNSYGGYVQSLLVQTQSTNQSTSDPDSSTDDDPKQTSVKIPGPTEDQTQDLTRATGDSGLYLYYVKSIGYDLMTVTISVLAVWVFFEYFSQVWLRWWSEAEAQSPGARTGFYLGLYAVFGVAAMAFIVISIWIMFVIVIPKSSQNLHWTLLKTVMGATLGWTFTADTGVTLNRFSQDMSLIDQALPTALFVTLTEAMSCIASLVLVCVGNKFMAAGIPLLVIMLYVLQMFYLKTSRQLRYLDLEAKSPLYTHFAETISGILTIRAFGWQNASQATNLRLLDNSQKPYYLMYCIQRWLALVLDLLVAALAVVLVALAMRIRSSTSAGAVGVALVNVLSFSQRLTILITSWTSLETSLGAISRLRSFEKDTPQETDPEHPVKPSQDWPNRGAIDFKDITVSYTEKAGPILKDVSFSVEPGQMVALCGRTGSGKSSLVLVLFRLLDIDMGSTSIDSQLTSSIHRGLLRSRINAIPQDPILFTGTVRFNAFPYLEQTPSDETILLALESVGIADLVQTHGGLAAPISSIPLSHGQKQLFCLARAILRKTSATPGPRILVLDEATANVDAATEQLMMDVIDREFSSDGVTVLAVMHRLDAVVERFDRVAVLDRGRLVEFDQPRSLLNVKGGVFRSLWDSRN